MRVGLGATVLARCLQAGGVDGIGTYTAALLNQFSAQPGIDALPVSYGYRFPADATLAATAGCELPFPPLAAYAALTGANFPGGRALASRLDLFHATDHLIPRYRRIPIIATIMDAVPLAHPEWAASRFRRAKNALWKRTARWAQHIITISEFSKREITEHFGIAPEIISVIPLGVDARWFATPSEQERAQVKDHYRLPPRFFLFIGTLQPRKNLARVVEAHRQLPEAVQRDAPLIIIGRAGWQSTALLEDIAGNSTIRWLNYVPTDDLHPILACATALVFPSLHEGFGLPMLEAFATGTPVVTSHAAALPEIAGNAALLVDPYHCDAIAHAMARIYMDQALAADLRAKGRARAQQYSWKNTAQRTMAIYQQFARVAP